MRIHLCEIPPWSLQHTQLMGEFRQVPVRDAGTPRHRAPRQAQRGDTPSLRPVDFGVDLLASNAAPLAGNALAWAAGESPHALKGTVLSGLQHPPGRPPFTPAMRRDHSRLSVLFALYIRLNTSDFCGIVNAAKMLLVLCYWLI